MNSESSKPLSENQRNFGFPWFLFATTLLKSLHKCTESLCVMFANTIQLIHRWNVFQIPIDVLKYARGHESRKYQAFNETQESVIAFRAYALLYSMYTWSTFIIRMRHYVSSEKGRSTSNKAMDIAHGTFELILMVIMWVLVYLKKEDKSTGGISKKTSSEETLPDAKTISKLKTVLECVFVIGVTIMLGTWMLMRVAVGQCDTYYSLRDNFLCNPSQDSGTLPIDSVVAIMLIPLSACSVFRGLPFAVQCASWLLTLAFILSTGAFVRLDQSIAYLLIFAPTSFFMLYEGERQNRTIFHMTDRLSSLLEENERLADETHANELRHMLGNVAHDLKTPLTSFIACMDMMGTTLDGFEESSQKTELTAAQVQTNVSALCDLLASLKNASTFMTMAINRCLDFTRASKGMTLISHPETFNLQRAMGLPMRVITDMQSRVGVVLLPIPPHICSHVQSDLQWLQENILCLVSNGVKYTGSGEVEIQISLESIVDLQFDGTELDACVVTSSKYTTPTAGRAARQAQALYSRPSSPLNDQPISLHSAVGSDNGDLRTDISEMQREKSVNITFSDMSIQRIPGGVIFFSRLMLRNKERGSRREEKANPNFLRFDVFDCGVGLSEESMLTIFNPFRQTQRMNGGVGLGLYSLAKRVQALGGYYGVSRRPDGLVGCRFFFGVPYVPDELRASLKEKPLSRSFASMRQDRRIAAGDSLLEPLDKVGPPSVISTAMRNAVLSVATQLHVLVVDDSMTVLKMVSMVLRKQGHTVETAQHGAEALDKLELARLKNFRMFDLVLMDLQMPVLDGLEAIRRIREGEHERKRLNAQSMMLPTGGVDSTLSGSGDLFDKVIDVDAEGDALREKERHFGASAAAASSFYVSPSRKLTNQRRMLHQCVVAMSAFEDPTASAAALAAGADKFICKPFTLDILNGVFAELTEAGKL